jgi:hypothetical protein
MNKELLILKVVQITPNHQQGQMVTEFDTKNLKACAMTLAIATKEVARMIGNVARQVMEDNPGLTEIAFRRMVYDSMFIQPTNEATFITPIAGGAAQKSPSPTAQDS